jgi:MFS transporter, ACS family, glucarate transporter
MAEAPTRVRYWVIVFAVALAVVTYIDRVCIANAAPYIRADLGVGLDQMGYIFSAFTASYALFEVPCGYLGDRIGPRRVLFRIVLWWSFFTAATGWTWNYASLMVTRFLFGAGEAGCFPNLTRAFSTWLPEKETPRAQGILWLSARWGGAFTPPLALLVIHYVGWRHAFEVFAVLGVVWGVLFYRWFRDDPADNPKMNAAELELLRAGAKPPLAHGKAPWGKLVRSRQVWMLCAQYFCLSYGWYFYITWLPTYLKEGRGLTITSTAVLGIMPLFFGGIGNGVGAWATAFLVRRTGDLRWSRKLISCVGFTGAAGFLLYSTQAPNPVTAIFSIAMASFCNDLVIPCAWTAAMDIGGRFAGTVSGTMNMMGNLAGVISPSLIGYILKHTGNWNLTFYISAAIYVMGIACWLALDPVTPLEEDDAPASA